MTDSARDWLSGLEAAGITLGLDRIRALLTELGHPETTFVSLTVAGTNGKGSVTAMVERGLRAAGRRTGRYISPHLQAVEERVAIDGVTIDRLAFERATQAVRDASDRLQLRPSYFEATTALALVAFRDANIDIAVLEVGLGGRLDATNAVDAPLAIVTNIGLDHQAMLGPTVEAIAAEKAGVIKPGAMVISGRTPEAARHVIAETARQIGAAFIYAPDEVTAEAEITPRGSLLALRTPVRDYGILRIALPGRHQIDNAVTAVRALEAAEARGLATVGPEAIRAALADVRWPGRLDWQQWRGLEILIDGAHNPDGARALADFIGETVATRVPVVIGVMRDKEIAAVLGAIVPVASILVFTAAPAARAASAEELMDIATRMNLTVPCIAAANPLEALSIASQHGSPIVVAGSLLLAGHVRALIA